MDPEQVSFAGLIPLLVLLETLDIFSICCHYQQYSFFHEGNFRRRLSNGELPDHLLFAVLANAIRVSLIHFSRTTHTKPPWPMLIDHESLLWPTALRPIKWQIYELCKPLHFFRL